MTELVDYSSARPSPAGLVAAGKTGVGRYVGKLGSISKQLGPTEAAALRAQGLDIFLLVEEAANSAMNGFVTGAAHAATAVDAAGALGAPATTALYFAVDFNVTVAQWPLVANYLTGAASKCGAARVGIYGGYNAMIWAQRDRVASWFFQTYAWSDIDHNGVPNWAPNNHIEQYHNGVTVAGGDVDLCRSKVTNYGQWVARMPRKDNEMNVFRASPSGAVWVSNGPCRWHVPDPGTYTAVLKVWKLTTADVVAITDADVAALGVDVGTLGVGLAGLVPHTHEVPAVQAEQSGPAVAS